MSVSRSSASVWSALLRYRSATGANWSRVFCFVGKFFKPFSGPFLDGFIFHRVGRDYNEKTVTDRPLPLSRLIAGPFPAIEERLLSRLPGWVARCPASECVLLVPSNDLREHLLRRLAARWTGFVAGAPIFTLYDFALRLLKHRGLFPREMGPARMRAAFSAAVREVYARGEGDFAAIAGTAGFLPALARTLGDLEEGWLDEGSFREAERAARRDGDAARAARWGEWRRLLAAVRRKVADMGGMTRRRIFQEAVAGFEQPGYPFRVILYGFYDFTRLQWTLVDALLGSGLLEEVYVPGLFNAAGKPSPAFGYAAGAWDRLLRIFEGNVEHVADRPAEAVAALRDEIFAQSPVEGTRPAPCAVLSAPHEDGEMRLAARRLRAWVAANPDEDFLLVSRRFTEGAVAAWERVAGEYGILTAERLQVPLASVPIVRVLLQMIEAHEESLPRRKVIDILSSPYRRHAAAADKAPRTDLWDILSRELLVVGGDDWETRMSRPRLRRPDEETEEERAEREGQLRLLREEVRALRRSLASLGAARGFAGLAGSLRSLLLSEFRIVDDRSREGERDRRAVEALFALLDDVALIPSQSVPWPGAAKALAWFRSLLHEQRLFLGQRGGMRIPGAVIAGDIHSLRGVTADRTIVLSVNEDLVPAPVAEDPLLPDEDRETLNALFRRPDFPEALPLARRSAAEEKLLFALPIASARQEVAFSVPRADVGGTARRPSRYLLHLLSRFAGPAVFTEDWAAASGARIVSLPRSPLAALAAEGPLSPAEETLARWCAGLPPADGAGGVPWHRIAGILLEWGRRRRGESLFPGPRIPSPEPASWTATELDELVTCPYRYFLRYRLGLVPAEEPEEGFALTPADLGVILHEALRRLGEEAAAGKGWGDPATAVRQATGAFARENPTGLPGLFRLQTAGIERDAEAFVAWERAREASPGHFRIAAVEQVFEIPAAGFFPAFRGRVDRIDRGTAGEAAVIDYKYRDGRSERPPLNRIRHGLSHQIPVYLVFAESLSDRPRAAFLFLRNGVREIAVDREAWEAVREAWGSALADWLRLARSGSFPPLPHHLFSFAGEPPPRYCLACPFRDHCRVSPNFEGMEDEQEALRRAVAGEGRLRPIRDHRPGRGPAPWGSPGSDAEDAEGEGE
jgi:ATP-dependent helicase/nuclease subunit B